MVTPRSTLEPPFLDVDAVIADRQTRIVICCGSGGASYCTGLTSSASAGDAAGSLGAMFTTFDMSTPPPQ